MGRISDLFWFSPSRRGRVSQDPGLNQPSMVAGRRPRYQSTRELPVEIDPVWQSRSILESAGAERRLAGADSWIYQLQKIDPRKIAASDADVAVIDYTPDGGDTPPFTKAQVEAMRRKKGGRKTMLAYMSIGEAQDGRFYWRENWVRTDGDRQIKSPACPRWLVDENLEWKSFRVKYWDPEWQSIILGDGPSYLNQIISAGFDGVYLDIVNGYQEFYEAGRKSAPTEMIEFVVAIARAARRQNSNFLVVPQNGEQLLVDPIYCSHISAIGKEDILFNNPKKTNDENSIVTRNPPADSKEVEGFLEHAKRNFIPVLAIEYLRSVKRENREAIPETIRELRHLGYIPYFGNRLLDSIFDPVVSDPALS